MQRLRTRKIIKEYKQESTRRAKDAVIPKESEEEILLTLLERVLPTKKGEEIYWFRDYEHALLEATIEETKQAIKLRFRPGNCIKVDESITHLEVAHTIEEIVNKQCC